MRSSTEKYHFPAISTIPNNWLIGVLAPASQGNSHADAKFSLRSPNLTPPQTASRANELCMPTCEVCENDYDKAFEVVVGGKRHTFDSFECAIHALAPVCPHCNCRIVGHGVEADGKIFCCVHCARVSGTTQLRDRA
jgi:hypothetical protein